MEVTLWGSGDGSGERMNNKFSALKDNDSGDHDLNEVNNTEKEKT